MRALFHRIAASLAIPAGNSELLQAQCDALSRGVPLMYFILVANAWALSVIFFDKIRVDDPVGAISVHGVCGIFGTLAPGIFGTKSLGVQLIGTLSVSAFAFLASFVIFYALKLIMGVRVDEQEEHEGLDVAEHGSPAYNDSRA